MKNNDPLFSLESMVSTTLILNGIDSQEHQIAALLQCRYGDGLVYLPKNHTGHIYSHLYSMAQKLGFIDTEGYLTRKGRTLLARHCYG
ncbi:MAG: hypothetical protein HY356_07940 [Gammaproteobacteria bacterium]|nr:hypothetical protein [Gammaproteobacteria bacterium]